MSIQTLSLAPSNSFAVPHNGFQEWGAGVSAAIQAAGLAKTQLDGFGIYARISKSWLCTAAASLSPSFTIPINVKTNDLMLVTVTTVSGITITTPVGWTLVRSDTASGGTGPVTQSIYTRYAAGTTGQLSSDGGVTVTWTLSTPGTANAASFVAYAGVVTSSPINVQGVASASVNGTTITAGALTTTVPNALVVQCMGWDTATISASATPTNYTARTQQSTQTSCVVGNAVYDLLQAAGGTTGTPTSAITNTGSWICQTIALAPNVSLFVPTTATSGSGGTLTAATYYYRVSATTAQGETIPCPEVSQVTSGSSSTVTVSWTQVTNATGYKVYGRSTGAELLMSTITSGSTTSFIDTGAVTPGAALNLTDTTADTGQINWGAAVIPSVASTKYGYDILQFTDSLQPTYPIFVRIDYGAANISGGTNTQLWYTIGTSSNGSGTIQAASQFPNSVTTVFSLNGASATWVSATPFPVYVDSDGGASLAITGWMNVGTTPTTSGVVALIERTREWDGTPNGEGFVFTNLAPTAPSLNNLQVVLIANSSLYQQPAAVSTAPASMVFLNNLALAPPGIATVGSTVYTYPYLGYTTPKLNAPSKHWIFCYVGDIAANSTFTATLYGSSHTFLRTTTILSTTANISACVRIT